MLTLGVCLLAGCLVTQEVHYEAPDFPSEVGVVRPLEQPARVPLAPDPECEQALPFEVAIADRDLDQTLYWQFYINETLHSSGQVPKSADPSGRRTLPHQCLPYSKLSAERCSRVLFFLTSNFDKYLRGPVRHDLDFESAIVEWLVLRGADDPDLSPADCAPPLPPDDAGLSP